MSKKQYVLIKAKKIFSYIIYKYLREVEKLSKITVENIEVITQGSIIVFWHGDSCTMNMVLDNITKRDLQPIVIVTADSRGDYIESVIQKFGGKALRINFSAFDKEKYKTLQELIIKNNIIAIAMDGPLGPLKEPKRLPFYLSGCAGRNVIGINAKYQKVLRLSHRWDKYVLPLPYSDIKINCIDFGIVATKKEYVKIKNLIKDKMQ